MPEAMKRKTAFASSARSRKEPAFVLRAERAMQRAARGVKKQNKALGLPLVLWKNGKVSNLPA
jgi:hypothetical protein